jgi:hypothetical protein
VSYQIKLYDRPGGTLLLDLTPNTSNAMQCVDVIAPPPPLNRKTGDSPTTDGGVVSSQTYGLRTVTLRMADTAGMLSFPQGVRRNAITALLRVLQRDEFWIELVSSAFAEARYLHCYRASDPELEAKLSGLGDRFAELDVQLLADPFAFGPEESLGTLTFTEANRMKVTVAAASVKGDVPAPLQVEVTSAAEGWPRSLYVATRRGGGVHSTIVDLTNAGSTLPSGTTRTAEVGGTYIGGGAIGWNGATSGQRYYATFAQVVSNAAAANTKLRGTYRVFMSCSVSVFTVGDVWDVEIRLPIPASWLTFSPTDVPLGRVGTTAALNSQGPEGFIDLGLIDVPYGGRLPEPLLEAPLSVAALSARIYLTARTMVSTGSIIIDALVVLPADDEFMVLQYADNGTARVFTVDPLSGTVTVKQAGVASSDVARVNYQGAPPMVCPHVDVDIYSVDVVGGIGVPTAGLNAGDLTNSWNASYWPRYLTVQ